MIAGVDEAGRGPLAGPVVAACVILPLDCDYQRFRDSKQLSPEARREIFIEIKQREYQVGVGIVSEGDIDRLNILQASLAAMRLAVNNLPQKPDFLLVDGKFKVPLSIDQMPLVKGDSRSASISAASIIAKVTRDELMEKYHRQYPQYLFDKHKGYPTVEHRRRIRKFGPCEIHRKTFKGVREYVS